MQSDRLEPIMRAIRYVLPGLLAIGLLITSVGWYRSASAGGYQHFDACSFDGTTLVLSYSYGANQLVSPRVDMRSRDVVVALDSERGEGLTPMIGLSGEARFSVYAGQQTVRYPDGQRLECSPGRNGSR
jgi:hypothetical protein